MVKIDLLRKLIREEVTSALRQELPKLLLENRAPIITDNKKALQEQVKSKIPGTLNTLQARKPTVFSQNNPMAALLNDTAKSMINEDFSVPQENVHPALAFQPREDKVTSVEGMLSSARRSSNVDAVQINEVPDFSGLMNRMREKGQI